MNAVSARPLPSSTDVAGSGTTASAPVTVTVPLNVVDYDPPLASDASSVWYDRFDCDVNSAVNDAVVPSRRFRRVPDIVKLSVDPLIVFTKLNGDRFERSAGEIRVA